MFNFFTILGGGGSPSRAKATTYGCLLLLGSVSVAGIVEIETNGKIFSKWAQSFAGIFKNTSSSPSTGSPITTEQVTRPFITAGQEIAKVAQQAWPIIQEAFSSLSSWNAVSSNWFGSIKNFLVSLLDSEIFNKLFENLHTKIWNVLSFSISGDVGRTQFLGLFSSSNRQNTLKATRFLLGLPVDGNTNLRAKRNVFNYLLLRWMDNPKGVTDKFERLSQTINNLNNQFKGSGSSGGGGGSQQQSKVYEVDIADLKGYLDVEKGWKESLYKWAWVAEIATKIKTGQDLTNNAKNWITSSLGSWFR